MTLLVRLTLVTIVVRSIESREFFRSYLNPRCIILIVPRIAATIGINVELRAFGRYFKRWLRRIPGGLVADSLIDQVIPVYPLAFLPDAGFDIGECCRSLYHGPTGPQIVT